MPGRSLVGGWGNNLSGRRLVGNLHKDFVLPDHTELKARTLLDRIVTLFQVSHLGFEPSVAHLQRLVGILLLSELPIDIPDPQPTALTQPQQMLQQHNQHE